MNVFSNIGRAVRFVMIVALVPALTVLAQGHKGKPASQPAKATPAPATKQSKSTPASKASPQDGSGQAGNTHQPTRSSEELVALLHSTKTPLGRASVDAQGHRARALREVDAAIKLLGVQAAGANPTKAAQPSPVQGPADAAGTGLLALAAPVEPLDEAQQLLQSIESQMAGNGINAHRYIQARDSVRNAIREVNLALVDR